ncbi:unnamed protein product [Rotaria sp. Silwood1]|nr:unnamed protein product [Rotaria sp. Silwood1]CAF1666972.1 unnamed protein product [Rotaria sp. Silwood1]CAF3665489.1 unnamed protein product [Rotaria sp. Silwood1]CAF3887726.1 unnamed protein product [Rotaria sp. Silwood1]CAF4894598.1 unnamed protein product [Rotaria sp. Silwood1]
MINDPPIIFIALIDCLRERNNVDLFYNFTNYSTAAIFTILLHLLHSLPQPLISYKMQDKIRISLSILHEHLDRNQRHAFILACLNEEKKN